jgi:hypothetical protein
MNNLGQNTVYLSVHEIIAQLEMKEDMGYSPYERQRSILDTSKKVLDILKSSPNGEVNFCICKSHWKNGDGIDELRRNVNVKISFFNTPITKGYMARTMVFISPKWNGEIRVFRGSINQHEDELKEDI